MKTRSLDRTTFCVGVLLVASVMSHVLTAPFPPDAFAFFQPSVTITTNDRNRLDQGEPVAHVIPAADLQMAVWAAVPVKIDADRLIAWMRRIEELKKSPYVVAIGRFSDPPRLDDLAGLSLDNQDVSDIMACRPGRCALKLSSEEMVALRDAAGHGDAALQQRFRQMVLDRVDAYLSGGKIGPYTDTTTGVFPGQAFDALLDHSPFLTEHAPHFAESLRGAPAAAPNGVESFLYWSKESLGGKPSVNVTDVHILRGQGPGTPDVVVAGKQIFATHYVNASLGVTALVHGEPGRNNYLVYVNRSEVDMLHGTFAGIIRWFLQRRLGTEAGNVLQGLRRRLESGEPPHPGA